MVNSPLIRPAIYWGWGTFGGVVPYLDCHDIIIQKEAPFLKWWRADFQEKACQALVGV